MAGNSSKITTDLAVDSPLVQGAGFRRDENDRQYLDNQIRGCEQHLVNALLRGVIATYVTLAGSSDAVVEGDNVCLCSSSNGETTVTKALATPLADAGGVFGVVLVAASPGSKVLVAVRGAVAPSITGLAEGSDRHVRVDTSTARCEAVSSLSGGDCPVGIVGPQGYLTLRDETAGGGGGGLTVTGTGFPFATSGTFGGAAVKVDPTNANHFTVGAANKALISNGAVGTWAKIVDANVDAAAAIDGSKIAPNFGAQNISTTGSASLGSAATPSTGVINLGGGGNVLQAAWNDGSGAGGNRDLIRTDPGGNGVQFGTTAYPGALYGSILTLYADSGAVFLYAAGAERMRLESDGVSLLGGAGDYAGASKILFLANCVSTPSGTPSGGVDLYAESGAFKAKGTSGTVTTIAAAEPHCPRCGTDVGVRHTYNDLFGEELLECRSCELRTGKGVVRHIANFFERRDAA